MQIQTRRLVLREFREDDLDAFHAMMSDPAVMQFAPTLPHECLEQTREWLSGRIGIAPGTGEDLVIEREGRTIGKVGFRAFPEIGFLLARDSWGSGLATEAVEAVLERAFTVHRRGIVTARVDPDNSASLRLLRKLGFIETRREHRALLVGTEWRDDVHLEIGAGQWRALRPD